MSEPDEIPRPDINSGCFRCGVTNASIDNNRVVVSPTGKAHYGRDYGDTECGIDATGDGWWWPL